MNRAGWARAATATCRRCVIVLLQLPGLLFQFLPVAVLIGSLLALGPLARAANSRCCAPQVFHRAARRQRVLAGLLLCRSRAAGEYLAPPLTQAGAHPQGGGAQWQISMAQWRAWVRDGDLILRADRRCGGGFGGIKVFESAPATASQAWAGRARHRRRTAVGAGQYV